MSVTASSFESNIRPKSDEVNHQNITGSTSKIKIDWFLKIFLNDLKKDIEKNTFVSTTHSVTTAAQSATIAADKEQYAQSKLKINKECLISMSS